VIEACLAAFSTTLWNQGTRNFYIAWGEQLQAIAKACNARGMHALSSSMH
jgi:hypothetical protein